MNNQDDYKKLIIENRIKVKKLKGEYKCFYKKIKDSLAIETQQGIELQNAISDILDILLDGMQNNRLLKDLFPDGINCFIEDLVAALPRYTPIVKVQRRIRKRITYSVLSVAIATCICFSFLWQIGYIGIWREGISYQASNLDKYSYNASIDTNKYSIEINLNDLDSNIGKILFQDDECTIDVYSVQVYSHGSYNIYFRSHGKYSYENAVLVSGLKHFTDETRYFITDQAAILTSEYNGEIYIGNFTGATGLNYKDGDMFGFCFFTSGNQGDDFSDFTEPSGTTIKVVVTNLCKNVWGRK